MSPKSATPLSNDQVFWTLIPKENAKLSLTSHCKELENGKPLGPSEGVPHPGHRRGCRQLRHMWLKVRGVLALVVSPSPSFAEIHRCLCKSTDILQFSVSHLEHHGLCKLSEVPPIIEVFNDFSLPLGLPSLSG